MNIGFYIKFDKHSINSSGNVIGDELFAESLCKSINKQFKSIRAELYAPNYLPDNKLDVMIYLNESPPNEKFSKYHYLYLQNGYEDNIDQIISRILALEYDGYIFFSEMMKKVSDEKAPDFKKSLFLPFGVDLDLFYPREKDNRFNFECAFVGNDIKGSDSTMRYLFPAAEFNFGLFGNWKVERHKYKIWKNLKKLPPYKKVFESISRGKIPQESVPVLYSSAQINLNNTIKSCIDWDVITLRTYEVLACKGFLISDSVPIAEKTLKDCLVFTEGGEDLTGKIKYYLAHSKKRQEIAQNGYDFVLKNCSIDTRVGELINHIQEVVK
jgi:spore maturation protein CgeB